jgi:ABC-2 type transport system permease protein
MIPFLTFFQREIARFMKVVVQTVLAPLVSASLYLMVFGVTLGTGIEMFEGFHYLAFILPGLVMAGVINNAYQNSGSSIVILKFTGEMEEIKTTPLTTPEMIWAMCLGAVVRGAVVGLVTLTVGELFYFFMFKEFLPIQSPLFFLFFMIMAGLVFGNMGIAAAMWSKNFDQMAAFSTFILLPLTYLGGVFVSTEKLGPTWQTLSHFNPLFYFINGMRFGILGKSDVDLGLAVFVSFLSLAIFHGIAVFSFKKGSFHRW